MTKKLGRFLAPSSGAPRLSAKEYLALCGTHWRKHWRKYTFPVIAVLVLQLFVRFDVNYTESLPHHVFVTVKHWPFGFERGDYVAYRFPTENPVSPFRQGAHMVKIIGGVAGDEVKMDAGRNFEIVRAGEMKLGIPDSGGFHVGHAKAETLAGRPLDAGPEGVIPAGAYYVFSPHKDSLDSRYAMVGWITDQDIIGRTFPFF